jgi:hypothetical protein
MTLITPFCCRTSPASDLCTAEEQQVNLCAPEEMLHSWATVVVSMPSAASGDH